MAFSSQVDAAIRNTATQYNIPEWFLQSLVARESSGDPNAVNDWDWASG